MNQDICGERVPVIFFANLSKPRVSVAVAAGQRTYRPDDSRQKADWELRVLDISAEKDTVVTAIREKMILTESFFASSIV